MAWKTSAVIFASAVLFTIFLAHTSDGKLCKNVLQQPTAGAEADLEHDKPLIDNQGEFNTALNEFLCSDDLTDEDDGSDEDDDSAVEKEQEDEEHSRVKRSPIWGGGSRSGGSRSSSSGRRGGWGGGSRSSSSRTSSGRRTGGFWGGGSRSSSRSSSSSRKSGGFWGGGRKSTSTSRTSSSTKKKSGGFWSGSSSSTTKKSGTKSALDKVQTALDVAGLTPGVGIVPDAINTGIHAVRGNWKDAAISAAAMVPGLGQAASGSRLAGKALSQIDKIKDAGKVTRSFAKKKGTETVMDTATSPKAMQGLFEKATGKTHKGGVSFGKAQDGRTLTFRDGSKSGPATLDINNKGDITKMRCTTCDKQ